jgi:hypothetical protein
MFYVNASNLSYRSSKELINSCAFLLSRKYRSTYFFVISTLKSSAISLTVVSDSVIFELNVLAIPKSYFSSHIAIQENATCFQIPVNDT